MNTNVHNEAVPISESPPSRVARVRTHHMVSAGLLLTHSGSADSRRPQRLGVFFTPRGSTRVQLHCDRDSGELEAPSFGEEVMMLLVVDILYTPPDPWVVLATAGVVVLDTVQTIKDLQ